ncbi:unnamed protein product [Arabidopsis lyrata]|nr:unnamed protein product [Arabidopsis lyrata]
MSDSNEKKTCNDSKQPILVLDLVRLVLERLSFVDFHRARCVSSGWYSASKSCIGGTNPTAPWIILFPNEHVKTNNDSCKLFDPRDHSSYTIRDLGFDMVRSRCLASSGSWFLMLDHKTDFHLLNLFTRERIPLPSLESIDGWQMKFVRTGDSDFEMSMYYKAHGLVSYGKNSDLRIRGAVLWVDEKTRDYFVVWFHHSTFAYHKKGGDNNSWKVFQPSKHQGCRHMVYKESKLYVLSPARNISVFDFSGGHSPVEYATLPSPKDCYVRNLAVTLSGEVLIISSNPKKCFFTLYKIDPKSSKWRLIKSIGDEALILDLGITVAAKDGVMRNCIYFSHDDLHRYKGVSLCNDDKYGICVYHIKTKKKVQVFEHLTTSSPIPFKDARWFFPTFGGK